MEITYLFILALAVSLDSFCVGIAYGIKKIKIPVFSIVVISIATAIMILLAMQIGTWLSLIISQRLAKTVGSIILISVGIWTIYHINGSYNNETKYVSNEQEFAKSKIISIEIKKIGLVIQILRTPIKADIDSSGKISSFEAVFLGIALSLDAFGAGLGVALIGFNPLATALIIAGMSGLFILLGIKIGFWASELDWVEKFNFLPGLILIMIGIITIL